ncbi:hypothetical protein KL930_004948 [Ogataea haglerorum]|uniref:GATA-type domain-containing protein n=1 Tax=Ogataea haglerorum TaxID=1937702 RepID=A0AAN6D7X7_9ASCO|nr:uncharacterized protein KL911_004932 [Ogataea haglerorum]KAG7692314.1 hypothetical protein KL915_004745 [Ogataea haglerorum]KAG7699839.1 hypothetical protein KL951_001556 [Ogataea haglerorum]KAG7703115.1 hypothetical protein KL914_004896 [Ogataea haglerorum]KAG7703238.1 hypothetical protein KL950_004872 [Ogataea haglerorum]KAG7714763.1 hypothetical protein KL949_004599 [Ogataea haglerorum]
MTDHVCANCGTTKTPLPVDLKKPPNLVPVNPESIGKGSCKGGGHCNGTGGSSSCDGCPSYNNRVLISHEDARGATVKSENNEEQPLVVACTNCSTTVTPLWRRNEYGQTICNACGLYYKLHGKHRPVKLKKSTIRRRKKLAVARETDKPKFLPPDSQSKTVQEPQNHDRAPAAIAIDFTATFSKPKTTPTSISITSLLTEDKPIN